MQVVWCVVPKLVDMDTLVGKGENPNSRKDENADARKDENLDSRNSENIDFRKNESLVYRRDESTYDRRDETHESATDSYRKRKMERERKRRARQSELFDELRSLLNANSNNGESVERLENTDLLEQTVNYMRNPTIKLTQAMENTQIYLQGFKDGVKVTNDFWVKALNIETAEKVQEQLTKVNLPVPAMPVPLQQPITSEVLSAPMPNSYSLPSTVSSSQTRVSDDPQQNAFIRGPDTQLSSTGHAQSVPYPPSTPSHTFASPQAENQSLPQEAQPMHYQHYFPPNLFPFLSGQISLLPHQTSTLPHQTSTLPHQTSTLSHQTSTLSHQTSTLPHQTSTLPHQTLTLPHQTSTLLHHASPTPTTGSVRSQLHNPSTSIPVTAVPIKTTTQFKPKTMPQSIVSENFELPIPAQPNFDMYRRIPKFSPHSKLGSSPYKILQQPQVWRSEGSHAPEDNPQPFDGVIPTKPQLVPDDSSKTESRNLPM